VTLTPASLPVAASVPSSVSYKNGAATRQIGGSIGALVSRQNPTRTTAHNQANARTSTSGNSEAAGSSGGAAPEQAFDDLIQQMSVQASATASQPAAPPDADQGFFRAWQAVGASSTPVVVAGSAATAPAAPAALEIAAPVADQKLSPGHGSAGSRPATATTTANATEHGPNIPLVPIDVVAALTSVKPKLAELASAGGGVGEAQLKPQAAHATNSKQEAALTVVIRNTEPAQAPAPATDVAATTQAAPYTATQAEFAAPVAHTETRSDNSGAIASVPPESTAPSSNTTQADSLEAVLAVSAAPGGADAERRKATGAENAAAPDNTVTRVAGPQAGSFQDLQLRAEPAKTDNAAPRSEAPKAPTAAAEMPVQEKGAGQPLKSVALEFTPDGTRDVKVRLSERGGEVHVSVHSTDPSMTKNLRAGVTDLASVLEHAGYDAKAWTGGRQQQGNPQQEEEQTAQRRGSRNGAATEQFDSILQQPNQENS